MLLAETKSFRFKEEDEILELSIIHPTLLYIFSDFNMYCYKNNLPVVITRAVDHNIDGVSVSNTHPEGRALDISVKGWYRKDIDDVISFFNNKYSEYAAISASDSKPRLIIFHDVGHGEHLHMQIRNLYRR